MAQISHREDLIEGAIKCLRTKGYARTSARDIAAASGAGLASIGYHFGSKDALLAKALLRSFGEWVQRVGVITQEVEDAAPLERIATAGVAARESFEAQRPLLVAFVEAMAQAPRSDELREQMAALYREGRQAVAAIVRASFGDEAERLGADIEVVASFMIAVVDGFALQWLLDPDDTPSGEELVAALGSAIALVRDHGADRGEDLA
jgi:AcrR family transcriptional regulator